jgi:hypothetical protein
VGGRRHRQPRRDPPRPALAVARHATCLPDRRAPVRRRSSHLRVRRLGHPGCHRVAHPLATRQPAYCPRHRRHRRLCRRGSRPGHLYAARQQARQHASRPRPRARPRRRHRQPDPDHPRPARRPPLPDRPRSTQPGITRRAIRAR